MEKRFDHTTQESRVYSFWERRRLFEARVNPEKQPFSIVLPPPNANADLHVGHAMYVYEDIMIRFNKLLGKEVLWLPGFDHAGFETQFVFEKHLRKQGKSRFDYDRGTLYQMIWDFVQENKPKMRGQLKRLGFALDWSKETFTMDPEVIDLVYKTFKQLYDKGLVYRGLRLVNYCVHDGTSFSDLETVYEERVDPLYYIKYGPFVLATVRPETKFGDTGIAVHPNDSRYKQYIGREITVEGLNGPFTLKVIADEAVDPEFGTGVVKVTPAHDPIDFEMGLRHNLPVKQVIGFDGRLNEHAGKYAGMKAAAARERIAEDLKANGLLEKIDEKYTHRVATCYKCGRVLEPLPLEQWFVKIRPLADAATKAIKQGKITFFPKKYARQAVQLLDAYHDWNISRQIVWGIRIPAFQNNKTGEWVVEIDPEKQKQLLASGYVQDEDTFDTWFSSGQWPFLTLLTKGQEYYDYFYPTSVMETGHDILRAWVVRMIMLGIEMRGEVPFTHVFLHGMVRDKHGQKMSKSKGNVVNPVEFMDKYGADALRAALIFGTKDGGDTNISEEKVVGMRNFANKLWNIGRFIKISADQSAEGAAGTGGTGELSAAGVEKSAKTLDKLTKRAAAVRRQYLTYMKKESYSKALELNYHFLWHEFADVYIEELKDVMKAGGGSGKKALDTLREIYLQTLVMIHPFMPFVTEAVWQEFHGLEASVMESPLFAE